MRLRRSSKWLILAALVAFASVLQEFPNAEAAKRGKKSSSKSERSPLHHSSRSKFSRTKGKKYSLNSSSSSSSASASVELGDKVSGINVSGSGSSLQLETSSHYSKVFKKGPAGPSVKAGGGGGSGYHVNKKGGSGGKSRSKANKLTIVTPSAPSSTTTPKPTTLKTTKAASTTERLIVTKRTTAAPKTSRTRTKYSFGLGSDPGMHAASWVGIDSSGGVGIGEGGSGIGLTTGGMGTFFAGGVKNYGPIERGGLYADGLDLDFAKVFPEEATELPHVTSNINGFSPVMVGSANSNKPHYDTLIMNGRVDELEKKVAELERTISTMTKNIEVLQQNTQVISKGFNILSGRVNKVTGDYELVNGKLEEYKRTLEEKITSTEQNVSIALISLQLDTTTQLEDIKQISLDALKNATAAANATEGRHPVDKPELCEEYMRNITTKMEDWQRTASNETKLVAEMVKALAEISQGEKMKLENLSNYSRKEIEKLGDTVEKHGVEHANDWDAVNTKLKSLRMEVEERDKKFTSDIFEVRIGLRNTTKRCGEEVKKVEDSILEQNMAHNMAHENIALKIDEMASQLESKGMDATFMRRLLGAEGNISTLFAANKQFLTQFASLEEMNGMVLHKIADLRTVHKNDNATMKKDVFEMKKSVGKLEHDSRVILDRLRVLQNKVDQARDQMDQMDVGRLGIVETESLKSTTDQVPLQIQVELGEIKDRIVTFEENVAEIWRSHKQIKEILEHSGDMVTALQTAHVADHEDISLQVMEIKIASKLLSEVVRNLSRNMTSLGDRIESSNPSDYSVGYSNFSSRLGESVDRMDTGSLGVDCKVFEEDISNLWELSRNISKAQELFLVKLLEMDMEHERDNKTVRQMLMFVMNRTEDFSMQFLTADERINKILQQFEFTDAEQAKMREELLNIKDRLAAVEENNNALWKASNHLEKGQDEIQNNIDNIILVHKTEAKNLTKDMAQSKQRLENMSATIAGISDRATNLELLIDVDTSSKETSTNVSSTEVGKLKTRLTSNERDIQELWKSSEILSFQQQVFNEKVRELQTVHENDTMAAAIERMRNQLETQTMFYVVGNMSSRLQNVEKYTSPPYESKTIEFEINNWNEALAGGLKSQQVVYENGNLLELPSTWRTFVERSGNYISLYNSLVKAEKPVYNEFTVEILDSEGKVYSTYGPDMHLYKTNEKIGWSSMITMSALQNPVNRLVTNDALRFRLRTKLYPNGKAEDPEVAGGPSEKQLIQWEMSDIASKLQRQIDEDQAFVDLNISKEFQAGHYWGGNTKWKTSLLMREIHHQNYLGINMELLHVDQNWRELIASYNVTMFDAHNRIVKEFSIASNDFKAVSARHSYFMLVNDVLEVLGRGDKLTIKIFFDLQARKRSFDVEFIRT